ncbi:MAG TPA: cation:proton antiporter [Parasulfuritortus sp.]
MFDIAVTCLVLTALLAYFNHRFIGLPTTIGVMGIALLLSFALIGLDKLGIGALRDYEQHLLSGIDFSDVLMQGMLSLLLFAWALHVDLSELRAVRWQVGALAVFGTLLSALLVGIGLWTVLPLLVISLPFAYCLLFGTLISPTDPIAVMGILKSAGAPNRLAVVTEWLAAHDIAVRAHSGPAAPGKAVLKRAPDMVVPPAVEIVLPGGSLAGGR